MEIIMQVLPWLAIIIIISLFGFISYFSVQFLASHFSSTTNRWLATFFFLLFLLVLIYLFIQIKEVDRWMNISRKYQEAIEILQSREDKH